MRPHSALRLAALLILFLPCGVAAQISQVDSISQHGITWKFSQKYPAGRYANGDWWVQGPVRIVEISPRSTSGSRVMNGSMINPSPRLGSRHGYDSSMKSNVYDASLNVALNVSASKPLVVPVHSSLVSTISVTKAANRPQLRTAAILTVLPKAAGKGDFRPPYCGTDKTSRHNVRSLDASLLQSLPPVGKVPSLSSVERMFERVWLDHIPGWTGREHHPVENLKHYGRDLSADVGIGALMLHLDLPLASKQTLLIRYVQLGIDLQGIVDDGGDKNWVNNGGHASGRKWPILFAGLMLNDAHMKAIGNNKKVAFGEDQQTFIVTETSPGKFNNGHGGYTAKHKGMAEWGINHATRPQRDDVSWGAKYRQCCTANCWWGSALAAYIMGAKGLWNHDPFFAYLDRYLSESRRLKDPSWMQSWDTWTLQMWDAYRQQPPQLQLESTLRPASAYAKPTGVHTNRSDRKEIRLRWLPLAASGVTQFRIFRGTSPSTLKQLGGLTGERAYIDPEQPTGLTLYYQVAGLNGAGAEVLRSPVLKVQT